MPKFSRDKFFAGIREFLESKDVELTQKRVDAIEFLISSFETEPKWKDLRHIAYAFSTIAHETAWTFEPIKEYRAKPGSKGRANQDRYWLSGYFGRGYVQLTWKKNYAKFGLADEPARALEPATAFFILTEGMHKGIFTGKKLDDFINEIERDYVNARKIINGLDKAHVLAGYAKAFEQILRDSKQNSAAVHTANQPNGVQPTATHDKGSNSSVEQPPDFTEGERPAVNIDIAENVNVENRPPPSTTPATVKVERASIFTKIGATFAAITALGINLGNVSTTKLNELTPQQIVWLLGAVLLIAGALWFYDRAAKRAHEKTLAKMKTAADPGQTTVELREQK